MAHPNINNRPKIPDELRYHCENCGATNDTHKSRPAGHEQKAVCIDCGAAELIRVMPGDEGYDA